MPNVILISQILIIFIVFCSCSAIIFSIRNQLVYTFRVKLLDLIKQQIGVNNKDYDFLYNIYISGPSYNKMLFSITKWTFNQFYPHALDYIKYR